MEIIRTPEKEIKCRNCDTVLKITNADLHERRDSSRWLNHGRYFLYCPICGEEITFKKLIKEGGEE